MTTTRWSVVALGIAVSAVLGYLLEVLLVRSGQPALTPPLTLAVALAMLGVIVPALAWPIRQHTRGKTPPHTPRPDPFYATRVLLIAKASAVTAAVLSGAAAGVAVFLLGRVVIVWPSVLHALLAVAGGVIMLVGALLAEHWCVLPPTDEAESSTVGQGEPA